MATKRKLPTAKLYDPDFEYTPAEHTNVTALWRKLGWTPPTEYRTDYNFKQEKGA